MTTTSIVDHPAADPAHRVRPRPERSTPRPPSLAACPPAPGGNGDSDARRNAGARNSHQCPAGWICTLSSARPERVGDGYEHDDRDVAMDARPPAWLAKHRGNECRDVYPVHHPVRPILGGPAFGPSGHDRRPHPDAAGDGCGDAAPSRRVHRQPLAAHLFVRGLSPRPNSERAYHPCGADWLGSASFRDQRGTNDSGPP